MRSPFGSGVYQAFPIVIGYLAMGTPFGILASKMGLSVWMTMAFSLLVYAGAAQFMALQFIAASSGSVPLVLATFVLNLRHALMSVSLGSALPKLKISFLSLFAHTITDESFGVNIAKVKSEEFLQPMNVLGTNLASYAAWNVATLMGFCIGNILSIEFKYLAGALPIMFFALMATQLVGRLYVILAFSAALLTLILSVFLPGKWPFLLSSIIIPTLALVYEKRRAT